ncbi:MAG: GNAT family N-acetyltransferase [Thermoplasmata archaeon]
MEIVRVWDISHYQQIQELQVKIWGLKTEPPVPIPLMVAMNNNGGLVEAAFDGSTIIGFTLAFYGKDERGKYLYSHMAGVDPEYRNKGIGYELKMHQFETAEKLGFKEIRWTFDPLKLRNSYFNTRKLKSFCYGYKINYYGIMGSEENQRSESDRIFAHHFPGKEPVKNLDFDEVEFDIDNPPKIEIEKINNEVLSYPIPKDLSILSDSEIYKWRIGLRKAITKLEHRNYILVDTVPKEDYGYLVFVKKNISGLLKSN